MGPVVVDAGKEKILLVSPLPLLTYQFYGFIPHLCSG
jgi:hypothetical protein